jgi:hypothetical protein
MERLNKELLNCRCNDNDHILIIQLIEWHSNGKTEDADLVFSIHLSPVSFWQRIIRGLRYIFRLGIYSHFDECLLDKDSAIRLKRMLSEFIKLTPFD